MNWLKSIWVFLTSWFTSSAKDTPSVEEKADLETVPDIAPNDTDVVPVAEVKPPVDQQEESLQMMTSLIAANAERYELNPDLMISDWNINRQLFIEAAYLVDWVKVVHGYSPKAMHRVLGHGTNFNFKGHPDLRRYVTDAIDEVSASRTPDAPDRNGMDPDGGQR